MKNRHPGRPGPWPILSLIAIAPLVALLIVPPSTATAVDAARSGLPAAAPAPPPEPTFQPGQVVEYHDASLASHGSRIFALRGQGYRPISLSVYGSPSTPSYAAVWVKRAGPKFVMFSDLTLPELQDFAYTHEVQGYVATLISATGDAPNTVFAGVFEYAGEDASAHTSLRLDETTSEFRQTIADQITVDDGSYMVGSVTAYGTGDNQRFAYIVQPNERQVNWDATVSDNATAWAAWYDGLGSARFQPRAVAVGRGDGIVPNYTSVWSDERVYGAYTRLSSSSSALAQHLEEARSEGLEPISIDAATIGRSNRFVVTYARYDLPMQRSLSVTGVDQPALAGFDQWMTDFLETQGVRTGSLAIARDGKLVYARAFTLAESDFPVTTPTSLFRIASGAKPLTALAMMQVVERERSVRGGVNLGTPVQSVLQLKTPAGAQPPAPFGNVTIDHLLCQRSGISKVVNGFNDVTVAQTFGKPLPVSKPDYLSWGTAQGFDFAPGSDYQYSNYNFHLLSEVVAARAPTTHLQIPVTYENAVRSQVFKPLGVTRPSIGRSEPSGALPDEVPYESPIGVNGNSGRRVLATSMMDGHSPVASSYGGWNHQLQAGGGGWALAPADFAKVVSSFDDATSPLFTRATTDDEMWSPCAGSTSGRGWYRSEQPTPNGSLPAWEHNGSLPSTAFLVIRRVDGLSFVVAFNGRTRGGGLHGTEHGTQLFQIANSVQSWPSTDLFPTVGIPPNS